LNVPVQSLFLTFDQLTVRWGISRAKVFDLARNDPRFPPWLKFGNCSRVSVEDVERYEKELRGTDARRE
jgi:hypothetical protein